jgi:DNA-binding transcriptional regulator GbsR (MarR family)
VNAVESDEQTPPHADVMQFVEQMGGFFESTGLTRLAGRLLGWLLVCEPERQSSEELAVALDASSGGISTNARMLIQFGFIERLAVAGDRRTYFRLRPNAFAAGERQRLQTMIDLQRMADVGLGALRGSSDERCRRLYEMRDLLSYMERALTDALRQYRQPTQGEPAQEAGLID